MAAPQRMQGAGLMILNLPDPHPGRCKNYRAGSDCYGMPNSKRCLGYEMKSHVCEFEPDPERTSVPMGWGQASSFTPPEPVPWVSPLDG